MNLNKYSLMFPRTARRLLGQGVNLTLELGVFVPIDCSPEVKHYSFEDFPDGVEADLHDTISNWMSLSVPDNCVLDFYCYSDDGLVSNVLFKIENGEPKYITEIGSQTYPWKPLSLFT